MAKQPFTSSCFDEDSSDSTDEYVVYKQKRSKVAKTCTFNNESEHIDSIKHEYSCNTNQNKDLGLALTHCNKVDDGTKKLGFEDPTVEHLLQQTSEETNILKTMPKGYKMLIKLGYRYGETLGSKSNNTDALLNPVKAVGQTSRRGIRFASKPNLVDTTSASETYATEYRNLKAQEGDLKHKKSIFNRMQKIAFEISGDIDILNSTSDSRDFNVLWRRYIIDLQIKQDTIQINSLTFPLQPKTQNEIYTSVQDSSDYELQSFEELSIGRRISLLHKFLRTEMRYCYYCGAKYIDDNEMYINCPGFSEEEHQ